MGLAYSTSYDVVIRRADLVNNVSMSTVVSFKIHYVLTVTPSLRPEGIGSDLSCILPS